MRIVCEQLLCVPLRRTTMLHGICPLFRPRPNLERGRYLRRSPLGWPFAAPGLIKRLCLRFRLPVPDPYRPSLLLACFSRDGCYSLSCTRSRFRLASFRFFRLQNHIVTTARDRQSTCAGGGPRGDGQHITTTKHHRTISVAQQYTCARSNSPTSMVCSHRHLSS